MVSLFLICDAFRLSNTLEEGCVAHRGTRPWLEQLLSLLTREAYRGQCMLGPCGTEAPGEIFTGLPRNAAPEDLLSDCDFSYDFEPEHQGYLILVFHSGVLLISK